MLKSTVGHYDLQEHDFYVGSPVDEEINLIGTNWVPSLFKPRPRSSVMVDSNT